MAEPFEPTPEEVHSLIPQRLADEPFSADTEPTDVQVEEIIADIALEVAEFVGVEIPEEHWDLAKAVVKRGAAAEVEQSFFPEQHDESDRATYARLLRRYLDMRDILKGKIIGSDDAGLSTIDLIGPTRAAAEARSVVQPWT